MKMFLYGWVLPVGALWTWYVLSFFDISFGLTFLSRDAHDFVFMIYGHILGIPGDNVTAILLGAFIAQFASLRSEREQNTDLVPDQLELEVQS